ncbi:MAG: tetratricopeptide repeat protein [Mangrovicoccus sp.]|nr:tetratricopeptide repeat protein [Mangrovicoccus sp.]
MYHDQSGTDIAISDPQLRAHWDAMTLGFLSHGRATPEELGAVIAGAPDLALPLVVKGIFCVLLGRQEMTEEAKRAAQAARAAIAAGDSCPRAAQYLAGLDAWLRGDGPGAVQALEQYLRAHPQDTLCAKIIHGMRFIMGDAPGMLRSLERVLPAHGEDHPYRGYLLGCRAFALEETGAYGAAEASGQAGLELARDDAWGLHAVAHVYDMTHRPTEGIDLIDANPGSWTHCNNFRYHVWWHKALLHLDRGETDTVLALYDDHIRADHTDDYRDIANGSSMLMRLALEGVDLGNRWEELADLSEKRAEDGQLVFADLHYMLALIGGGRAQAAQRLRQTMARRAKDPSPMGQIAADPGQAAITGLADFAQGQYDRAFTGLSHAMAGLQSIGGSHAQRDVFERITVDAGLRAGAYDAVEQMLLARAAKRGGALDSFAETRLAQIADANNGPISVPAQ